MFSRIPVLHFFTKFLLFSTFLKKQSRILQLRSKNVSNSITIYLHKKKDTLQLLEKKKNYHEKKFVDSEFVKTSHEQVIR